jgi:hypothetical protein
MVSRMAAGGSSIAPMGISSNDWSACNESGFVVSDVAALVVESRDSARVVADDNVAPLLEYCYFVAAQPAEGADKGHRESTAEVVSDLQHGGLFHTWSIVH